MNATEPRSRSEIRRHYIRFCVILALFKRRLSLVCCSEKPSSHAGHCFAVKCATMVCDPRSGQDRQPAFKEDCLDFPATPLC
jgi:hypothetical protein